MEIRREGTQAATAGAEANFAGAVRIHPIAEATPPGRLQAALVTFEAGARTAWHTHPLGQTLFVTSGVGRVQSVDGPVEQIRRGDIVWTPPGEKHWHGAGPSTPMSHVAIQEARDGQTVVWMEHVRDPV